MEVMKFVSVSESDVRYRRRPHNNARAKSIPKPNPIVYKIVIKSLWINDISNLSISRF